MLSFDNWLQECAEATLIVDGESGDAASACHDERDRIRSASEGDAANFIWMELPKERKAEWDARLIRSVLDTCLTYVLYCTSRSLFWSNAASDIRQQLVTIGL